MKPAADQLSFTSLEAISLGRHGQVDLVRMPFGGACFLAQHSTECARRGLGSSLANLGEGSRIACGHNPHGRDSAMLRFRDRVSLEEIFFHVK